jgi:autotransporter-associated beta strand protein
LLVSNTFATFASRVSNFTTVRVVNSTATFSAELLNAGRLVGSNSVAAGLLTLSNGTVATVAGAAQSWTAAGNLMGNNTLNIGGSLTLSGVLTNTGSLTKVGAGQLHLTGSNTYNGVTLVNDGTLRVNGYLGSSALNVNSGGTLGGTGTIAGAVTVANGGTFSPGNGIGTQRVGALTMETGSFYTYEFQNDGLANDKIMVTNLDGLTINGGGFYLYTNNSTFAFTKLGRYDLIGYTNSGGGPAYNNLNVLNQAGNRSYTFAADGASVYLTIAGTGQGWTGNSAVDSYWMTASNWVGNVAPEPYEKLTFDGTVRVSNTNNFSPGTTFSGIVFTNSNASGNFVLNGNLMNLAGNVENLNSATHTINLPLVLQDGHRTIHAQAGNLIINGAIGETNGSWSLTKTGSHTVRLSGINTYTGGTLVNAGTLILNGSVRSNVTVAGGATLGGYGTVAGVLQGAGTIAPGLSPGILTASQVAPTNGLTFNFEFTQLGSPTYTSPSASGNDVLRLTNNPTPFTANLGLTNTVNLFVTAPLVVGQTNVIRGGFYTDRNLAFDDAIINAMFNLFINNQPLNPNLVYVTTVNDPAFSQNGWVMEFGVLGAEVLTVVPEPSVFVMWLAGLATFWAARRRSQRESTGK